MTARNPKKWATRSSVLSLNTGYEISPKATLLLDLKLPLTADKSDIDDIANETAYVSAGAVDSTLHSNGTARRETATYSDGLSFRYAFGDGSEFTVCADYLDNNTLSDRTFTSVLDIAGRSEEREGYTTAGSADYSVYSAKADYTFSLWGANASVGAKATKVETASDNSMSGGVTSSNTEERSRL